MKSTVPVGTGREIAGLMARQYCAPGSFDIASNPEFLREGSAIGDFMRPDRVVIGVESERAARVLQAIYRPLYLLQTPVVLTALETAEMIKYAANAFLATKITFINEIADSVREAGCGRAGRGPRDRARRAHRGQVPACRAGLRRVLPAQGHARPGLRSGGGPARRCGSSRR